MKKCMMALAVSGTVVLTGLIGAGTAAASEPPGGEGGYACRVLHDGKKVGSTVEIYTHAEGNCAYAHAVLTAAVTRSGGGQVGPQQKFCNALVARGTAACLHDGIRLRIADPAGTQTYTAVGYVDWLSSSTGGRTRGDYTKEAFRY